MTRPIFSKVLSASDLLEGDVIYLAEGDVWTRSLIQARVFLDAITADEALKAAEEKSHSILGAYLFDVRQDGSGTLAPTHFREAFRATGPSNLFHGKQANSHVAEV